MSCPTPEALSAFATGSGDDRDSVEQHLDSCASCRRVVSEVAHLAVSGADEAPRRTEVLPSGTKVGRYEIQNVAGAGGMGVIYTAHDPTLNRTVALKLVRPDRVHDDAARLLAEAKVMAKLAHPDVLPVFDAGTFGDEVFLAMEWVDGQTLRAWLATPRAWREVLEVFVPAGRGLVAAHDAGIIHRDFKPENVLIGHDGRVRVSDFGLARELSGLAVGGVSAAGTRAYMAPELLSGDTATAAVDQYSFAVALEEALGSRGPGWLRRVLSRARREDPSQRFSSMRALLAELTRRRVLPLQWAAAVVLLGVGGWFALRPSAVEVCDGSGPKIRVVWNAARRAALIEGAEDQPTMSRVAELVDDFAARWTTQRRAACVATHVHHEVSASVLDLEMSCFQRQLMGVDALLNSLVFPGHAGKAIEATRQATSIQRCTDVAFLTASNGGVVEDARTAALRQRMALIRQQLALGPFSEAGAAADAVLSDAKKLGVKAIEGEAQLLRARTLLKVRSTPEQATIIDAAIEEAVLAGTEANYPHLVAEAFLERMRICTQDGRFDEAMKHERMLAAHLQGLGPDPWLQARHDERLGSLLTRLSRPAEALAAYAHGLEMAALLPEVETMSLRADLVSGRALALITADDFKGAREELELATQLAVAAYGERYSRLGEYFHNLGELELQSGRYDSALKNLDRAGEIWSASYGATDPRLGINDVTRADALSRASRHEEALAVLAGVKQVFEATHLDDQYPGLRRRCAEGDVLRRKGELAQSAETFRAGIALADAKGQFPFDVPMCRLAMSETLLAQGDRAGARAEIELAMPVLKDSPSRLAQAQIVLSEVDASAVSDAELGSALAQLERQDLEPTLQRRARKRLDAQTRADAPDTPR